MTAALEGVNGQQHAPAALSSPGKTQYAFYRRLCGPQGRSLHAKNFVPTGIFFFCKTVSLLVLIRYRGPPLWSSRQSFWLQIQRSRVRSPALPDFLSSSGSGTGSTQPREVKLRSYLNKKVAAPGSENRD